MTRRRSRRQANPRPPSGLQFGERLVESGRPLFGIGAGIVRDIFGWGKDIPSGLAMDLGKAGNSLLRGDVVGAAKGVGGAALNAVARTGGGLVDSAVKVLHGAADIVDTMVLMKPLPRKLTDEEKALLDGVYKGSVNLDDIRVRQDSLSHLFLPVHAIGNTIYFKDKLGPLKNPDGTLTWDGKTLVHETGHVWQNNVGGGDYLHKAFFANAQAAITQGDRNKAYDWKSAAAQGVPFEDLNPEQQAAVIDSLAADDARPQGQKWLTSQETEYARKAMELVRAGRGAP